MAKSLKEILGWFEKNKYPTQQQFKEAWTSFWHKSEKMPQNQVMGLEQSLRDKASKYDLERAMLGLQFKQSVSTFPELILKYPNAKLGWLVKVVSENIYYQYSSENTWEKTDLSFNDIESNYSLTWATAPLIYTLKNNTIEVVIRSKVNVFDNFGRQVVILGEMPPYQLIIPNMSILIYDIDSQQYKIQTEGADRPNRYSLLASNLNGKLSNGILSILASQNSSLNQYQVVFSSSQHPLVTYNGASIDITIIGTMYILDKFGVEITKYVVDKELYPDGITYTINNNNVLIFDMVSSEFEVLRNNDRRTSDNILIASNHEGTIINGLINNTLLYRSTQSLDNIQVVFGGSTNPTVEKIGALITVTFKTNVYFINRNGIEIAKYIANNSAFTLAHNEILIFDIIACKMLVMDINAPRPYLYSMLLSQHGGQPSGGVLQSVLIPKIGSSVYPYDYTLVFQSLQYPELIKSGISDIYIQFVNKVYVVNISGVQVGIIDPEECLIKHNQILVFDLDKRCLLSLDLNAARPLNYVFLAYNYGGELIDGLLLKIYSCKSENIKSDDSLSTYNISFGLGQSPKIETIGGGMRVTFENGIYIVDRNGKQIASWFPKIGNNTFIVASNHLLLLDIDSQEMCVLKNNDLRPKKYVLLLFNSYNRPIVGQLVTEYIYQNYKKNDDVSTDSIPITTESRYVVKLNDCESQGLTAVDGVLWHFKQSADDNSNPSIVKRWNVDTFDELKFELLHNLGHAASADYSIEHDSILVGNGTYLDSILPRLDIILNASKFNSPENSFIDINSEDVLSINFHSDNKELGGSGLVCCWGESQKYVYLLTGQNAPRTIYRVELGVGQIDFSDKSIKKDDVKKWGNFIPGKSPTEFNGTAQVVGVYRGPETGVYQGCTFKDGYIWLCTGYSVPYIYKIKCYPNGTYKIIDAICLKMWNEFGESISIEPEGVCINDIYMYVGFVTKTHGRKLVAIPIYGQQGGFGKVEEKTYFDFQVNGTPNIHLTPTSTTTDLYISEVTSTYFVVKSSSGNEGTFTWKCNI